MLLLLLAAVAHFVAWIGAVLNTAQLPDKTWFVVLLVVGLLGLVFYCHGGLCDRGPRRGQGKGGGEWAVAGWPGSAAGASVDHQRALRVVDGGADSCLAVTGQPA
jgi:hypothetical protein